MKVGKKSLMVTIEQPTMAKGVYTMAHYHCIVTKLNNKYLLDIMDVEYKDITFNGKKTPNDYKSVRNFFKNFNELMGCDLEDELEETLVTNQMLLDLLIDGGHLSSLF